MVVDLVGYGFLERISSSGLLGGVCANQSVAAGCIAS